MNRLITLNQSIDVQVAPLAVSNFDQMFHFGLGQNTNYVEYYNYKSACAASLVNGANFEKIYITQREKQGR